MNRELLRQWQNTRLSGRGWALWEAPVNGPCV